MPSRRTYIDDTTCEYSNPGCPSSPGSHGPTNAYTRNTSAMIASDGPATRRVASSSRTTRIVPNTMSSRVGSIARNMPGLVNSTAAYTVTSTDNAAATQRNARSIMPAPRPARHDEVEQAEREREVQAPLHHRREVDGDRRVELERRHRERDDLGDRRRRCALRLARRRGYVLRGERGVAGLGDHGRRYFRRPFSCR